MSKDWAAGRLRSDLRVEQNPEVMPFPPAPSFSSCAAGADGCNVGSVAGCAGCAPGAYRLWEAARSRGLFSSEQRGASSGSESVGKISHFLIEVSRSKWVDFMFDSLFTDPHSASRRCGAAASWRRTGRRRFASMELPPARTLSPVLRGLRTGAFVSALRSPFEEYVAHQQS